MNRNTRHEAAVRADSPTTRARRRRARSRGLVHLATWAAFATALVASSEAVAQCATAANPIVCENALPGSTDWRLEGPISTDSGAQIQGYASATSVDTGASIDLHVTVAGNANWDLEIYRMGWYGGAGGRLMLAVPGLTGVDHASTGGCTNPTDVNHSYVCNWPAANGGYTLNVPTSWTTGIYLAKLESTSTGHQAYAMFAVREDDRDAVFYYEQAVMNYQAYNRYPGSDVSFYSGGSAPRPWLKTLSFDRPYGNFFFRRNNQSPFAQTGDGSGGFFTWDFPMIQWLEQEGYDVSYATNVDLHLTPDRVLDFSGMISVGHDEYWTDDMAEAAAAARDAGVGLAFFAGNHVFGTVTYDAANRTITGVTKAGTPGTGVPSGNLWWDAPDYVDKHKRQALFGQANTGCCVRKPITYWNVDWIVDEASHWAFAGTGFVDGDAVPGLLGYEPDGYDPQFDGVCSQDFTLLSASPFDPVAAGAANNADTSFLNSWPLDFAHTTIYQAPRKAWVFSAGSTDWPWGLATPFAASPEFDASRTSGTPDEQGFLLTGGNGVLGTLLLDGGLAAYEVDANAVQTSLWQKPSLYAEGSEAQTSLFGTTVRAEVRVLSGDWITFYAAAGSERFIPKLRLDSSGAQDLLLLDLLTDAGDPTAQVDLVLATGAAATQWHTHEVVVDPVTDQARYHFDGSPVGSPWNAQTTSNSGLYFGQGSTPAAGAARFRNVAHVPTHPMDPDTRIQTLSRNVLDAMAPGPDPLEPIAYDARACDPATTLPADSTGTPARQGWAPFLTFTGTAALTVDTVDGSPSPVWHADGTGGAATWNWDPSAALEAWVATNGWRIESRVRVLSGDYVTDYYADGSRRFLPILRRNGSGDLAVQLEGGGAHVLATGADADDYHTHVVRFNPLTQDATYFFDGVPIETWSGSATTQRQITFGQGASFIAGQAYYQSMSFEPAPEPSTTFMLAVGTLAVAAASARRRAGTRKA